VTIGRNYLLEKPPGPSAPKRLFDQRVIPLVVNLASRCEFALDDASQRTGVRPSFILFAGTAVLVAVTWSLARGRTSTKKPGDSRTALLLPKGWIVPSLSEAPGLERIER
jgi:hypothetical protein